jgi:hypothetical protein
MRHDSDIYDTNTADGASAHTLEIRVSRRVESRLKRRSTSSSSVTESGAAYATALEMSTLIP